MVRGERMSVINKFSGEWGTLFSWLGARTRHYNSETAVGVTETWLIGKSEKARNFAVRYYEVDAGGHTNLEEHAHDHGIVFLRGQGQVLLAEDWHEVVQGDVVYIAPDERHQIVNTGEEALGFLCVIPAIRLKEGEKVWAEG